jgi:UbiD family decarboxylase
MMMPGYYWGNFMTRRGYADMREHIEALDSARLLRRIDATIDKDTELHPLVRWQFRGGIREADRKAFLFENVIDGTGRRYDMPVVVGALAASAQIYAIGMGVDLADIGDTWRRAISNPIPPVEVSSAPCHDVVISGDDLANSGLDILPVPISTPGFDSAPYLTATNCITRDPDSGIANMGTYRCGLKSPTRMGLKLFVHMGQGGYTHWHKYRTRGERMPIAVVLGPPPVVSYCGPQSLATDVDEIAVAGGIAGAPIEMVRAKTVDLQVPAQAEIVIEGLVDTEFFEPEGPFGESHGHINLEEYNFILDVTAITHRDGAILPSIISQVTPSESSVIKRVAYEPRFLGHLRDDLGIKGVNRVALHEPLTNLRRVIAVQFARDTPTTEIWRALYGCSSFDSACGKYVIAINDDIDPENSDAVMWAMAYRANPGLDIEILRHRGRGHGPVETRGDGEDAALLVDATLKTDMAPIALPTRDHMEHAKNLWKRLELPTLGPEAPWHGYSLGNWSDEWDAMARRATQGGWRENGERSAQRRRDDVDPNSPLESVEEGKSS